MGDPKSPSGLAPMVLSILRIAAAIMFIPSGTMKLFGWPALPKGQPKPELLSQLGIGGMLELVGGALILVGFWTRPTAFILSGTMAVAYWQFHATADSWYLPAQNHGTAAALFCFAFLYFAAAGAGPLSLDAMRKQKPG